MNAFTHHIRSLLIATATLSAAPLFAQVADGPDNVVADIPANNTESKVAAYTLPEVLKTFSGHPVATAREWTTIRRPELLEYYSAQIFGRVPPNAPKVFWKVTATDPAFLNGKAVMKNIAGHMGSPDGPAFTVTLYTPVSAGPAPVLINLSLSPAPGATRPATAPGTSRPGPSSPPRGTPAELISHGFALAIIHHAEIETDRSGAPNVNIVRKLALAPGQTAPAPDEWGTIAAWAWGISRFVDYLQTDAAIDPRQIAVTGASRGGKTVLWAAVTDPRIALCIASCSGEGGAALARRNYGETVAHLLAAGRYPYQFAANFAQYAKDPATLSVDTHMLLSLVAPRPLLLQTGNTDRWSDPVGEFKAAQAATPVYQLLGEQGLPADSAGPETSRLTGQTLAYFMHEGGHGPIPSDWDIYLQFLESHLKPR